MNVHNIARVMGDATFLAMWGALVLWSAWFGRRRSGDFW